LTAFYDFPAQHRQSIHTSNPIESTFGTIRHRTKRSKGCLIGGGMLHMVFELGQWLRKSGDDHAVRLSGEGGNRNQIQRRNRRDRIRSDRRLNQSGKHHF